MVGSVPATIGGLNFGVPELLKINHFVMTATADWSNVRVGKPPGGAMKRLLWLVLVGMLSAIALPAVAKQADSRIPAESQNVKKHKHHRHHKNPHKNHIEHDQYPSAGAS